MKDPAVLFYTSDFLTGTAFFTDSERGQYIRLLCEQHQNGHIPENHMVSVCLSLGSPVIKKFVKDENGLYYNIRMEDEIIKRREFAESRRENGLKGGRPKLEIKALGKPSGKSLGKPTENLIEDIVIIDNYYSLIKEKVLDFFPEKFQPKTETQIKEWADCFKKLIEIDGYSENEILEIIFWARQDDFWSSNFLSILKLRKKNPEGLKYIDVFKHKKSNINGINRKNNSHGATDREVAEIIANKFGTDRPVK